MGPAILGRLFRVDIKTIFAYIFVKTGDIRQIKTEQIIGPFYAYGKIHFTSGNASFLECATAYIPSSVPPSVTLVNQSKTVEGRIMQFPPYGSPIPLGLVFAR